MSAPTQTEMIAEGKAKRIYATTDPTKPIIELCYKSDELGEVSEAYIEIDRRTAQ